MKLIEISFFLLSIFLQGEAVAHFPSGPLRPPDINPAHYMHPNHVIYQQYLRQQQLHLTRIDKGADSQEGEEAPVTSPPLELRRPGSVGHALTSRGVAVPHSLHSPHDRATGMSNITSFLIICRVFIKRGSNLRGDSLDYSKTFCPLTIF